jgi:hypothetical protein
LPPKRWKPPRANGIRPEDHDRHFTFARTSDLWLNYPLSSVRYEFLKSILNSFCMWGMFDSDININATYTELTDFRETRR